MNTELRELGVEQIEEIKTFFTDIFTKEPWNDDWSDKEQLHAYIMDLIGNRNSLTLGFFADGEMAGLAMGETKHWYEGTEYFINELCVETKRQGQGIGTKFVKAVEEHLATKDIHCIFLLTEEDVPAYHFYEKNGFKELKSNVAFAKGF